MRLDEDSPKFVLKRSALQDLGPYFFLLVRIFGSPFYFLFTLIAAYGPKRIRHCILPQHPMLFANNIGSWSSIQAPLHTVREIKLLFAEGPPIFY